MRDQFIVQHCTKEYPKRFQSRLVSLPQELIDRIIELASDEDVEDTFTLAITCTYFFRLIGPSLRKPLLREAAPWAGDRLIFLGDYADSVPDIVKNGDDWTGPWPREPPQDEDYGDELNEDEELLFNLKEGYPPRPQKAAYVTNVCYRIGDNMPDQALFDRLLPLLKGQWAIDAEPGAQDSTSPARKEPGEYVLRNLNAREYVRDSVLANSEYAYSLGEVVCTHIHWTDDSSGTADLGVHGRWAGHRFDIVRLTEFAAEEWVDVSESALDNLVNGLDGQRKDDGLRA